MESDIELARFNMIEQQVRPWDVLDDRVLDAMATVRREAFVPAAYQGLAFADIEIPLGGDAVMLEPRLVGRLLQALAPQPDERVLEIGTGSGYVTACLARLGAHVISYEINPELAAAARERLQDQAGSIEIREGDGLVVPIAGAPFDAIAVTGSMPNEELLTNLEQELALGGRLFCIFGEAPVMEATLITRIDGHAFSRQKLFETVVPALHNVPEVAEFVF